MAYRRLVILVMSTLLALGGAAASGGFSPALAADTTPPVISFHVVGTMGKNSWFVTPVTVSWIVQDPESGIASSTGCGTVTLASDTVSTTLTCSATNGVGLKTTRSISGRIDLTPPTVNATPTTNPDAQGWYNHDVTFHWSCSDATSGLATPCPSNTTLQGEGKGLSVSVPIADRAGNVTMGATPPVNIDRTSPITSISAIPAGWIRSSVNVTLTPHDNLSGVAATYYILDGQPQQQGTSLSITADGLHTLEYWSLDNAGNSESHHTVQIMVDQTPPTITHQLTPPANANGWNNTNVTVTFQCSDATSGLASCPGATTLTGEGAGQMVAGTATDVAGNSASDNVTLNIDKTPPVITGAPTTSANANGWYGAPVVIHWTCSDALSGIAVNGCPKDTTLSTEGTNQSAQATATDAAGNTATATVTGINIDLTAPTLTAAVTVNGNPFVPGPSTWTQGSVVVTFQCSDALSGVDTAPSPVTVSSEGANQTATGVCTDKAGNQGTLPVNNINIDRTPPTLNPTVTPNPVLLNGSAVASAGASDPLSGVATQSCSAVDTSSVGTKQVTCTATDVAGNSTSGTGNYAVAYGQQLLYNPSLPKLLGYPIIFALQLVDANNVIVSSYTIQVRAGNVIDSNGHVVFALNKNFYYYGPQGYKIPFYTAGLPAGQYYLQFTAGADPTTHLAPFTLG